MSNGDDSIDIISIREEIQKMQEQENQVRLLTPNNWLSACGATCV